MVYIYLVVTAALSRVAASTRQQHTSSQHSSRARAGADSETESRILGRRYSDTRAQCQFATFPVHCDTSRMDETEEL